METLPMEFTTDILRTYLGDRVMVSLKSGASVYGLLRSFDEHINLLLNTTNGTIIIKGETILFVGKHNKEDKL